MNDIRCRLRAKRRQEAEVYREANKIVTPALALSLRNLESQIRELHAEVERIGAIPPSPHTSRGRIGSVLVRVIRRSLFWLIPTIQASHIKFIAALEENRQALVELTAGLRQISSELLLLRGAAGSFSPAQSLEAPDASTDSAASPDRILELVEKLERNIEIQAQIQRELFTCLASERTRSRSARRGSA